MRETPSQIGARAEAAVAAALVGAGLNVYLPVFGANGRVDLVFADATGFHGVQCKAARVLGEVLSFRTCSNTANVPRACGHEVDFFGAYAHELEQVFLVLTIRPQLGCRAKRGRGASSVRWPRR